MTIRVAAIAVGHWHALNAAAYLRHLVAMPDVELVGIQDADAGIVAKGAAVVGLPPPIGVHDCLRAVRLIDQAYASASAKKNEDHRG